MASVADLECLRNWRRGDVHAGLDLVSRHVPELRRFVRRRLRRDIEDVVQQTLVIFLEKGPQFRADSSVTTFLLGIARNLVYAELRRRIKIGFEQSQIPLSQSHKVEFHEQPSTPETVQP